MAALRRRHFLFYVREVNPLNPKEQFLEAANALGLDACGACSVIFEDTLEKNLSRTGPIPFAPPEIRKRLSPEELLPGARSFFVILFPYKTEDEEQANIALYARPRDYHRINHRYMEKIEEEMKALYPDESFLSLTDTSPMVDRWLAYAAGLGFFGRNHCLIHPAYGSYVTIGAILTTLALTPDRPLSLSCGDCHACIGACPGQVLGGKTFNPWHCKSYLTQKKEDLTSAATNASAAAPTTGMPDPRRFRKSGKPASPSSPVKGSPPSPTAALRGNTENTPSPGGEKRYSSGIGRL